MPEQNEYLAIEVERRECCGVFRLDGEMDLATVDSVERAINEAAGDDSLRHLIVDGEALTFIDSSGIRTLLAAGARWDRPVAIARPQRIVEKALTVAGLTEILQLASSVDEARNLLHANESIDEQIDAKTDEER